MLADDADADTADGLLDRFEAALADAAEAADGADPATVEAVRSGDAAEVTVEDAAALLAAAGGGDADAMVMEVRDRLLLSMSSAVLDVEAIAADLDGLDPKEIQAKIEGRHPMTVGEYARLRAYIEG